ncbi:hypothetical protein LINGRAHAP2_LOCUS4859 [Linum grandiflorum]
MEENRKDDELLSSSFSTGSHHPWSRQLSSAINPRDSDARDVGVRLLIEENTTGETLWCYVAIPYTYVLNWGFRNRCFKGKSSADANEEGQEGWWEKTEGSSRRGPGKKEEALIPVQDKRGT